jgi:hypothetical protein
MKWVIADLPLPWLRRWSILLSSCARCENSMKEKEREKGQGRIRYPIGPFRFFQLNIARGKKRTSVLLCTSQYFFVLLRTSSYFFILLGTSRYFLVLLGTSWYFSVLLGTSWYFLVLLYLS